MVGFGDGGGLLMLDEPANRRRLMSTAYQVGIHHTHYYFAQRVGRLFPDFNTLITGFSGYFFFCTVQM